MSTATLTPPPGTRTITTPGMSEDEFALMQAAAARMTRRINPTGATAQGTALTHELGILRTPDQYTAANRVEYIKCDSGIHWADGL